MEEKKELQMDVQEAREMTESEVESVASLLFTWWRREYEQEGDERMQNKLENGGDR